VNEVERAKSTFLRLASHELRTPLSLLNGYVSMLADGDISGEHLGGVVPILQRAIDRMNSLVEQFMDATRLRDGGLQLQRQQADLRVVVEHAIETVALVWNRGPDVRLRLPEDVVPVDIDRRRIDMVVGNLVDNAFKYSAPGSRVDCQLRADDASAWFSVRDEGIGMDGEEVSGLFTLFGRVAHSQNDSAGGVGLGLFLTREVVRLHGGDVSVVSEPGRGSCFDLLLPLSFPVGRVRSTGPACAHSA
jgi:signal transduction histidine kinase